MGRLRINITNKAAQHVCLIILRTCVNGFKTTTKKRKHKVKESMPLVDLNPYPANKTAGLIFAFTSKHRQNLFSRKTPSL